VLPLQQQLIILNASGPVPGVSRLTGYQDTAYVFVWTSPIKEHIGQANVAAKIRATISIELELDFIERAFD
jgi:hypothetical protein